MKKMLALLLAVFFVLSLAACSSSPSQTATEAESSAEGDAQIVGGWSLTANDAATLPEEVQTAFDKATETITGGYYVPVGYIGSQVVAGMNYALLCELLPSTTPVAAAVEDGSEFSLKVIIIYKDLNGNAEITRETDFNLADFTQDGGKTQTELLAGGWSAPEEVSKTSIPDDAQTAFDKATESFVGNDLEVMALLGTQVVASTNYAFLCHSSIVTAEPVANAVQVVTVYQDLDGNAEITNICTLDAADFNN